MNVRSHLRFAMPRALATAAVFVLAGIGLGATPSSAAEQCETWLCARTSATPSPNGWTVNFALRNKPPGADDPDHFFQLLVPGHSQIKAQGPGGRATLNLSVAAGWNGTFSAQICWGTDLLSGSSCAGWETFQAEFLIAEKEVQFCNGYADRAATAAVEAQQLNCGFEAEAGRWSTDPTTHRNWCVYQFQQAGGVANKLVAATNLVNEAEAIATGRVDMCRSDSAAAQQAVAEQVAYERQVTGKTMAECQQSNTTCEARFLSPAVIAAQCTPYFQMCMNNAAAAQQAFAEQIAYERQVTGKTAAQCQESNALRINRVANLPDQIQSQCAPYFQQCMTNAAAAVAAATSGGSPQLPEPPAAPGGGQPTTSICGLPGGTATVVIPDPAVTQLNVRDKPNGTIQPVKIPEGTQVTVVGGCGVELAAGITAGAGNAEPPVPGWCAISSPQIGCVSEQFLVAGIPPGPSTSGLRRASPPISRSSRRRRRSLSRLLSASALGRTL